MATSKLIPGVTVGIPTYYGGESLVRSVKSILGSTRVDKFELLVAVDGNPLQPHIQQQLESLGARVVLASMRGGQVARIKQLVSLARTEIIVLTQDDITWEQDTLYHILKSFQLSHQITMVGTKVLPHPAETWLERLLEIGVYGNLNLGLSWRNGDNFLLASGRCLAFKTQAIRKFNLPEEVINSDALMYFENKRLGGKFIFADKAIVWNRSPQHLKEYIKQRGKFAVSNLEMSKYLPANVSQEYNFPFFLKLKTAWKLFVSQPLELVAYLVLQTFVHHKSKSLFLHQTRFWDTDLSTKR